MSNDRGKKTGGAAAPSDLQAGLDKVDKMIAWGRRLGYTQAAINLEQWRNAKGDRVMPSESFRNERFLLNHLRTEHRQKFIAGARKRIASGALKPGGAVEMDWTDSVNATLNSDLWFALGGFTVHSKVRAQLSADGKTLSFPSWLTDISDVYDWDAGKSTLIPGIGRVTDDEMAALEAAGYGKKFNITSEKAPIIDPSIVGDETL